MGNTTKTGQEYASGAVEVESRRMLTGRRVLIIEDVGVVAMALKAMLEALGCTVAGTAARLPEARQLMLHEPCDVVLVDLNLGGEYAFPLVDILRERRIPFVITSGYDAGQLSSDLAAVPQLQKPFDLATLEAVLLEAFSAAPNAQSETRPK
jgi:CheY-like chemotaxis protein